MMQFDRPLPPTEMLLPPSPQTVLDPNLIARLADEMIERWHRGEEVRAEELLDRHRDLWNKPQQALELVYEEICLRREFGQQDGDVQVLTRFPQWRQQLAMMLECHRLLEMPGLRPHFPQAGATLAGYRLLRALGRGAGGRVFLATQADLADRPVVLKFTALSGREHLNLARLTHTHIVPLYAVHDEPTQNLRILCMPYFGGVTLDVLLQALAGCPDGPRCGERILQVLATADVEPSGPALPILGRLAYTEAVTWIGACLADALHYAHQSNLIHFDVKPANILIAADGQPMLLDFHLARGPLRVGHVPAEGLGGTPAYMPPEQHAALRAAGLGQPVLLAVDHRADVYSLGAVLYEALGGALPIKPEDAPLLDRINPRVSPGLADIIAKSLATRAEERYAGASELAGDLRRHLTHQPLLGARNRSWRERWQKWRRRRPAAIRLMVLLAIVLAALGTLGYCAATPWQRLRGTVEFALTEGRKNYQERGRFDEALEQLTQALEQARTMPWQGQLVADLEREIGRAERARAADRQRRTLREVHLLAEQVGAVRPGTRPQGAAGHARSKLPGVLGQAPGISGVAGKRFHSRGRQRFSRSCPVRRQSKGSPGRQRTDGFRAAQR